MRTRTSVVHCFCCLLVVGTANAYAEPESMARPTRPKMIASAGELKGYFDLVKDQHFNGRARYGKRADIAPVPVLNAWENLKMILDAHRQNQQRRQERFRPNKGHALYRDSHVADVDRHVSRVALARPNYLLDIVGKYDDDVQ